MSVFLKTCIGYNVLTHRDQFHQRRRLTCRWPSAGPAWPGVDPAHCYSQQASGPGGEWRSTSLVLIAPFSERKRTVQAIQTSIPIGTLETWRLKVSASVQLMCARWPVHALLFSHKRELVRGIDLLSAMRGLASQRRAPRKRNPMGFLILPFRIGTGEEGYVRPTKSARAGCACMVA